MGRAMEWGPTIAVPESQSVQYKFVLPAVSILPRPDQSRMGLVSLCVTMMANVSKQLVRAIEMHQHCALARSRHRWEQPRMRR